MQGTQSSRAATKFGATNQPQRRDERGEDKRLRISASIAPLRFKMRINIHRSLRTILAIAVQRSFYSLAEGYRIQKAENDFAHITAAGVREIFSEGLGLCASRERKKVFRCG